MKNLFFILAFIPALAKSTTPDWLPPLPEKWHQRSGVRNLPDSREIEINSRMMSEALSRLRDTQAIVITRAQAKALAGHPCNYLLGRKFVLIRTLVGHQATGKYSASTSRDGLEIAVIHVSLGFYRPPDQSAIIVRVWKLPKRVYASCGFAL
jgi:hypothetical protein